MAKIKVTKVSAPSSIVAGSGEGSLPWVTLDWDPKVTDENAIVEIVEPA